MGPGVATSDRRSGRRTLNNLAVLARVQWHNERMAALADEAFDLSRQVGDPEGIALALVSRGIAAHIRGQPLQALALLERSLSWYCWFRFEQKSAQSPHVCNHSQPVTGRA
jgi:hypothetical protein